MLLLQWKISAVEQGKTNGDGGAGLEGAHTGLEVRDIVTQRSLGVHDGGGGWRGVVWLGIVSECTKVYRRLGCASKHSRRKIVELDWTQLSV
jgi:hypothetical protein